MNAFSSLVLQNKRRNITDSRTDLNVNTAQKMKFSITDFFSFLRYWLHSLKKSVKENFFCAVQTSKFLQTKEYRFY